MHPLGTKRLRVAAVSFLALGLLMTGIAAFQGREQATPCGASQPCTEASSLTDAKFSPGIEALRAKYIDEGYLWVVVHADQDSDGSVVYKAVPGDVYHYNEATIEGASARWANDFIASLPMKTGDIYRPKVVEQWTDTLMHPDPSLPVPPYTPVRITVNTDRVSHTVSLVLEVVQRP